MGESTDKAKSDLDNAVKNAPTSAGQLSPAEIAIINQAGQYTGGNSISYDPSAINADTGSLNSLSNIYAGRLAGTPGDATSVALAQAGRQTAAGGIQQALGAGAQGAQAVGQIGNAQDNANAGGMVTANHNAALAQLQKVQLDMKTHLANLETAHQASQLQANTQLAAGDRANALTNITNQGKNASTAGAFQDQQSQNRFIGGVVGAGLSGAAAGFGVANSMGAFNSGGDLQLNDPSQSFGAQYGSTPSAGASLAGTPSLSPPVNPFTGAPMQTMPSASSWGGPGFSDMGSLQLTNPTDIQ